MKKISAFAFIALLCSTQALARDTVSEFPVQDVLSTEQAKAQLGTNVRFYFGDQKHPKIINNYGDVSTNKKTNAFGKSDKEACDWVFLSAMIALKERAVKEGGNAVVNIRSNYKDNVTSSTDSFQCGAGNVIAGVALIGQIVRIAD